MAENNSISTMLPELLRLFNNSLESFEKVNQAITSSNESVTINIQNNDGTNSRVTIPSFGTFSTRKREAREGRHPAWDSDRWNKDLEAKYPGGKLEIPESHVVTFKAGKGLKKNAAENLK